MSEYSSIIVWAISSATLYLGLIVLKCSLRAADISSVEAFFKAHTVGLGPPLEFLTFDTLMAGTNIPRALSLFIALYVVASGIFSLFCRTHAVAAPFRQKYMKVSATDGEENIFSLNDNNFLILLRADNTLFPSSNNNNLRYNST
ncbi:hypothetical protein AC482_00110 [miscellaneous Crenarchaeota group-15 archaeon DG-45]|uniref:Uncharacterized protein n=1 Tax=miscellaneous Crenarchaeota group-15 archaeon DG-45 TaxID=1685127 RepID=A0A0M0BT21_9ARCH|nr:MAG: hypothetical protein AC482_00110 [miscellaneous Crenarchaeota group-15 archaeon DG-45]